MIVKLEQDSTRENIEVLIKYAIHNQDVDRLISLIKSVDTRIKCEKNGKEKWINASDIYYVESVDKKTFLYCREEIYLTEFRLYQLLDMLSGRGFVQISKSCILNINTLDTITPKLNSRMEATLTSGDRLYVSRKYLSAIKQALQGGGES